MALNAAVGVAMLAAAGVALAADATVTAVDNDFAPDTVTIGVGDSVTWVNEDEVGHTATSNDARFQTALIPPGGSVTRTFDTAGTYGYFCEPHPWMTGTIEVQAASGGSGGGGGGSDAGPTLPPADTDPSDPGGPSAGALRVLLVLMALAGAALWLGDSVARRRRASRR